MQPPQRPVCLHGAGATPPTKVVCYPCKFEWNVSDYDDDGEFFDAVLRHFLTCECGGSITVRQETPVPTSKWYARCTTCDAHVGYFDSPWEAVKAFHKTAQKKRG